MSTCYLLQSTITSSATFMCVAVVEVYS